MIPSFLFTLLLLATTMASVKSQGAKPCPEGWTGVKNKCYKVLTKDVTFFTQSQMGCKRLNPHATLVTIKSQEEQDDVDKLVFTDLNLGVTKDKGMWLDGSVYNEKFYWIDGTPLTYTNWGPNKPDENFTNRGPASALALVPSEANGKKGQWINVDVQSKYLAVCQLDSAKPCSC